MRIPSSEDWGNWSVDLDQEYAYKMFHGKNIEEVESWFGENPIERADDLRFMPATPFQYYIRAFMNFILSPESRENSDAASCYLRVIQYRLERDPESVVPLMPSLLASIEAVADRQSFYDAPEDIYGDFGELRHAILREYRRHVPGDA